MIKLVNKPSFFDGRNLVMRDWVIEMDNYLEAVCWDPRQTLGVATQFLKKDAMKWWDLKKKQLHAQGKVLRRPRPAQSPVRQPQQRQDLHQRQRAGVHPQRPPEELVGQGGEVLVLLRQNRCQGWAQRRHLPLAAPD